MISSLTTYLLLDEGRGNGMAIIYLDLDGYTCKTFYTFLTFVEFTDFVKFSFSLHNVVYSDLHKVYVLVVPTLIYYSL